MEKKCPYSNFQEERKCTRLLQLQRSKINEPLYENLRKSVEARLREEVEICEKQYSFMPGKSTTDEIFALRTLLEKYREG